MRARCRRARRVDRPAFARRLGRVRLCADARGRVRIRAPRVRGCSDAPRGATGGALAVPCRCGAAVQRGRRAAPAAPGCAHGCARRGALERSARADRSALRRCVRAERAPAAAASPEPARCRRRRRGGVVRRGCHDRAAPPRARLERRRPRRERRDGARRTQGVVVAPPRPGRRAVCAADAGAGRMVQRLAGPPGAAAAAAHAPRSAPPPRSDCAPRMPRAHTHADRAAGHGRGYARRDAGDVPRRRPRGLAALCARHTPAQWRACRAGRSRPRRAVCRCAQRARRVPCKAGRAAPAPHLPRPRPPPLRAAMGVAADPAQPVCDAPHGPRCMPHGAARAARL